MIFFLIDQPNLLDVVGWAPQIVIIIDLERGRLRIVDNGAGLNPQQVRVTVRVGAGVKVGVGVRMLVLTPNPEPEPEPEP